MPDSDFWRALDRLVAVCDVVIDRPSGSAHPRYPSLTYPYDYGYLGGTRSGDGAGIDVWAGSLPHRSVTAIVCTVDLTKRDAELKLLLGCTPHEAREILAAQNAGTMSAVLLERPVDSGGTEWP